MVPRNSGTPGPALGPAGTAVTRQRKPCPQGDASVAVGQPGEAGAGTLGTARVKEDGRAGKGAGNGRGRNQGLGRVLSADLTDDFGEGPRDTRKAAL